MKKILYIIVIISTMAVTTAKAQLGFGTSNPASTSVVDITATNKGILLPRVALTGLTDVTTIPSAANALTVFNTATTTLHTANDVTPGYYYWNGIQWVRLLAGTDAVTSWTLKGNAGTAPGTTAVPGINFLGTTDAQDLVFRTNSVERLRLTQTGRLLFANTTGSSGSTYLNMFIGGGNEATTGGANVGLGYQTFKSNTTGTFNVALGSGALVVNTSGAFNIALGSDALGANTTGAGNVALGYQALLSNIGAVQNVAIGLHVLQKNTAGNNNTAIGTGSLNGTTASNNTAIGYNTLTQNTTGTYNTAIGYQAGYGVVGNTNSATTGRNNTLIGANTNLMALNASNQLNIANNIFGTGLTGSAAAPAGFIGISTITPKSTFQVNGSIGDTLKVIKDPAITTVILTKDDYTILKTGTAAASIAITLPVPATCPGRVYRVIDYQGATGSTTFNTNIQTVGIGAPYTSVDLYELAKNFEGASIGHLASLTIQSDGTDWYSIGR